jgi:membrane fusion protein, copper/silver efflux system
VSFIYPTVDPATRTARLRIELPNEDGSLKPDLFGTVEIATGDTVAAVAIPESAVLDSGTRRVVLIERGGGAFEPREVELGARGDGYVEVTSGLAAGERVVVNGNFLIDAESNFKAALENLGERAADPHAGH